MRYLSSIKKRGGYLKRQSWISPHESLFLSLLLLVNPWKGKEFSFPYIPKILSHPLLFLSIPNGCRCALWIVWSRSWNICNLDLKNPNFWKAWKVAKGRKKEENILRCLIFYYLDCRPIHVYICIRNVSPSWTSDLNKSIIIVPHLTIVMYPRFIPHARVLHTAKQVMYVGISVFLVTILEF